MALPTGGDPVLGAQRGENGGAAAFRDVDDHDASRLVAMMDATDAWPAVQAARSWVLRRTATGAGSIVVDVGSGPGTFGAEARAGGAVTIDVDRSSVMLSVLRQRRPGAAPARADVARLPFRDGAAGLVHAERVLQWSADPVGALLELRRVTTRRGCVAITDTDWGSLVVDHPDPAGADRVSAAARAWVPHPTLARTVPRRLHEAGATEVAVRTDAVPIVDWDPDDPNQLDGPPGLPLRTIAEAAPPDERLATLADVDGLADLAHRGRFFATLTLVTAVGRF